MPLITAIREAQIPVLALMLIGASVAKIVPALLPGRAGLVHGPAVLYPARLRRPLVVVLCAVEAGLAVSLVTTAGLTGRGAVANSVRLATGLLFLLAACALAELRSTRPDLGCGCFGEFSTAPVSLRTLIRSALLAAAALATVGLGPVQPPRSGALSALTTLGIFVAELAVLAALSPELGVGLIRLGYSEPCEMRTLPVERTMLALRKSAQWRRHAGLITAAEPADVWRELCWRYVVYPSRSGGREAELVFAVYLRPRRPVVLAALVDSVTAAVLPWPEVPARPAWLRWLPSRSRQAAPPPAIPVLALAAAAAPAPGTMAAASRGPDSDAEAPTDPGLATAAVPAADDVVRFAPAVPGAAIPVNRTEEVRRAEPASEVEPACRVQSDSGSRPASGAEPVGQAEPERESRSVSEAEQVNGVQPASRKEAGTAVAADRQGRDDAQDAEDRRDDAGNAAAPPADVAPESDGQPTAERPPAHDPVPQPAAVPSARPAWFVRGWRRVPAPVPEPAGAGPAAPEPVSARAAGPGSPAGSDSSAPAASVSAADASVRTPAADPSGPQPAERPAQRPTPWFTPVRSRRS